MFTDGRINGTILEIVKQYFLPIAALIMSLALPAVGGAQTAPVADAGPSRYAAVDPIRLDGTGSFDPDGGPITHYEWFHISGPEIEITDADTATPLIGGFVQTGSVQTVEISLVVGNGTLMSAEDSVEVIIVPRMAHRTMSLINPPFRPDLPTLITFGGGDCVNGVALSLNTVWQDRFNIITGHYYYPYAQYAYQVIVLLSELAPEYDQPIQTIGFSTGGMPASVVANALNQSFQDPRFAVNRMTLLDPGCDEHLDSKVASFNANPVAGEPAWAEVYSTLPIPIPGALNVSFFGGNHHMPVNWFLGSAESENWTDGDMYNQGVTGGYFVSVGGPARNLQIATDDIYYYFRCRELAPGCLDQFSGAQYPGLLPEPVRLIGPESGAVAGPQGAVLTCDKSQHATSYELLFGPDPAEMTISFSETTDPPDFVISEFPFSPTFWTIRVRDAYGSTIFAQPRAIYKSDTEPIRRANRRAIPDP